MPKRPVELSEISIRRLRHTVATGEKNINLAGKPYKAMHAVGGVSGLYLQCLPPKEPEKIGPRSWLYRATIGKKIRSIGLGRYPDVPTKKAREAARALQEDIKAGIDPVIASNSRKAPIINDQNQGAVF